MIVVSDTSAISGLLQIGQLKILSQVYSNVLIPQAVFNELLALEKKRNMDIATLTESSHISVEQVKDQQLVNELCKKLDKGESEAIALAIQIKTDFLLIDELEGRAIAKQHGLQIIGLLGVLVEAKRLNFIAAVKPLINDLRVKVGFRVNDTLQETILKMVNEA